MRPLKPEERQSILARFPEDAWDEIEQDIEEYQSLLAESLRRDPESQASPAAALVGENHEERIAALRRKLYGPVEVSAQPFAASR